MRDPYLHFYQVLLLPPVEEHGTQQQHRKCFLNFHAPPVVQENYAAAALKATAESLFSPPFQSLLTSTTVDDDVVV